MNRIRLDHKLLVRRAILVIYDVLAVICSTYGALLVRYDFRYKLVTPKYHETATRMLYITVPVTVVIFLLCRLYSSLWEYAGATEIVNITAAVITATIANMVLTLTVNHKTEVPMPRSTYITFGFLLMLFTCIGRYFYRALRALRRKTDKEIRIRRVLVVGAGSAGNALIKELKVSSHLNNKVVGVIDDDNKKIGSYIHGVKVVGNRNYIPEAVEKYRADEIIVAMPAASAQDIKAILDICKETGCELKRIPGIYQLVNGEVTLEKIRDVDVNDLLGRDPIRIDIDSIIGYVKDKVIMVTGGGGSIGSELCRQIAKHQPKQLLIVDIYENTTYDIQNELKRTYPELNLVTLIASVRNTARMDKIFETYHPEIVYHAAAHKHVPLMEDSPNEAVKNNVLGTWKIVQAADRWGVKRFVMISTDKAVNPTNIMGATKRICEMIIQTYNKRSKTEFVAVRFGNVLGSNGSVIPLFKKQIAEGGPVTVTHPDIIRYFMTIPEAVSLVLEAGAYAKGGEIFVLNMGEPVKIVDLAKNLILLSGHKLDEIPIVFTGLRPGEKLYEELLMEEEGLKQTANDMIKVGKPIEMDEERFLGQLEELAEYVVEEPEDIRDHVQQIVTTYHPKENC